MKRPRMPRVQLPRNKVKPSQKVYRRMVKEIDENGQDYCDKALNTPGFTPKLHVGHVFVV